MLEEYMLIRRPLPNELLLLKFLTCEYRQGQDMFVFDDIMVTDMKDGGMGSLRIFDRGLNVGTEKNVKAVSACRFTDIDGIDVVATLYIDKDGNLYELDLWKTDFSRLLYIPGDYGKFKREIM